MLKVTMRITLSPPTILRTARAAAGLRQIDLARAIGRTCSFVNRLEARVPVVLTPELRNQIAEVLQTPEAVLFAGMPRRNQSVPRPRLATRLKAVGLTQKILMRELGLTEHAVREIYRDEKNASPEVKARIAELSGRTISELFPAGKEEGNE